MQLKLLRCCLFILLLIYNKASKFNLESQNISSSHHEKIDDGLKSLYSSKPIKETFPPRNKGESNDWNYRPRKTRHRRQTCSVKNALRLIKTQEMKSQELGESKKKTKIVPPLKATKGYYKPPSHRRNKKKRCKCEYNRRKCYSGCNIPKSSSLKRETLYSPINFTMVNVEKNMLEKVMRTTTKDPNKKNPGDQGMEYSEYYNEEDTVNDLPDENIWMRDNLSKNPITRSEREASYHKDIVKSQKLNQVERVLIDREELINKEEQSNQTNPYSIQDLKTHEMPVQNQIGLNPDFQSSNQDQYNQWESSDRISYASNISENQVPSHKNQTQAFEEGSQWIPDIRIGTINSPQVLGGSALMRIKRVENESHVVNHEDQNRSVVSTTKSDTQVIANQILNEIVDELEELKLDHSKRNHREGRPCTISGYWITTEAGAKLKMKIANHTINVDVENQEQMKDHQSLINTSWILSGKTSSNQGGPFFLTGTNNKTTTLLFFIGSCRTCHGSDTIEGAWVISREPRDCRDFQLATEIHNDIFRRIRIQSPERKRRMPKS